MASPWVPVDETSAWKPVDEQRPDFAQNPPSGVTMPKIEMKYATPLGDVSADRVSKGRDLATKAYGGESIGSAKYGHDLDNPQPVHPIATPEQDASNAAIVGSTLISPLAGPLGFLGRVGLMGTGAGIGSLAGQAAHGRVSSEQTAGDITNYGIAPELAGTAIGAGIRSGGKILQSAKILGKAIPGAPKAIGVASDLKDVWSPPPVYPGADLPAKPDAQFLKENMGIYPGAHLPEAPSPVYPGGKFPQNPGAKFLKQNAGVYPGAHLPENPGAAKLSANIAVPEAPDATALNRPYAGENFGKVTPVKTPSGLNAENAAHSNGFFEQVKAEHPEMSVSQQLMEAAKRENAPAKGIPGKPTVIPSPSSEAYKSAPPPLEARIPGPNEDMTALLSKSVENVKAPVYDDETVAAAAKGLQEQGYDPKHIQQVLQKMGLGPKTGMNVDEVFSQYPPGDAVQPFAKERAAAIEAQGLEADAIKSKLTKLRGVKVPPSPAMTPEEIKARLLKFQR